MNKIFILTICLLLASLLNNSIIAFAGYETILPKTVAAYPVITETNEAVIDYISQISISRMMSDIETLQNFETRYFQHPNSKLAQDLLKEQFEMFGLMVELQAFDVPPPHNYSESDNIISIQYGTEFPDEFIVCGAHYDSYSSTNTDFAPGADDNASGTAGILEIARILSQYDFKRSIVYCAWSGEEAGLLGSASYAQQCATQGMNIVAYFNMDMIGYVAPGENVKIHFSNPPAADRLADYCKNICEVYFPEMPFSHNNYMSNSDHRSFINVGYMGITSIEYDFTSNPHYHQPDDLIGLGVNSTELVSLMTKANIASIATLAMYEQSMPPLPLAPPLNCVAKHTQGRNILITWEAPVENSPQQYSIFRDEIKITVVPASQLQYIHTLPQNDYDEHCYKVTAGYYVGKESDFSNESCVSIPVSIMELHSTFTIYPNPTKGEIYISGIRHSALDAESPANMEGIAGQARNDIHGVEIFDVMGRTAHLSPFGSPTGGKAPKGGKQFPSKLLEGWQAKPDGVVLNISHLPSGIYFVKIITDNGIVTRKIVKQ